ncbi:MAG: hypothetical protein HYX90_01600 [Chloroflexi bacterium]|nr:hypothetical protein [Chloroflexota bacterium]
MGKEKISIMQDGRFVGELDRLVDRQVFQICSQAIGEAVREKLQRMKRNRFGWGKRKARHGI